MALERVDKLLSRMGYGSRREVAALISNGRVTVNGRNVKKHDEKIDPEKDKVSLDGKSVIYRTHWYFMLNKPAGVITAVTDPRHKTVFSILPQDMLNLGLFPVGRLDKDTEGLLLLTTDGDFSHALMSPRRHVSKEYIAIVDKPPAFHAEQSFLEGITLKDGTRCLPATLTRLEETQLHITLCEGKYHQVKRMLKVVGCEVQALKRVAIGTLPLDAALAPGQYRELTKQEMNDLLESKTTKSHSEGSG